MRFAILLLLCSLFNYMAVAATTPTFSSAKRIISLSPHTTELAYAAGLGSQLIAASDYSDYPEQAKSLERVANYRGIKLERIVALQPDLILAWRGGNPAREMERLKQLGFNIFYSNPQTLDDIASTVEALGHYAISPAQANQVAADFRERLSALKTIHQHQRPVRYFYQLSSSPIITIAGTSWPSQVFDLCGGQNIFADSPAAYPQVSEEQVIVRQPDVIFRTPHGNTRTDQWQRWQQQLPAVENGHLFTLTADWLNRPTPRTIRAVEQVCDYLDTVRQGKRQD